jgi:prephenate dehydrogenase
MAHIAIIGLDTIGASIGLALKKSGQPASLVGVDRDGANARRAQQLGAVEKTEGWISSAVKNASLVILCEPLAALRELIEGLGESLPQGCVVVSTAPIIAPVLAWAEACLPEGVSFIAAHPILNPTQSTAEPSADLFQKAQLCVVPSRKADSAAMDLVAGLAAAIGAQPFFLDAAEHDGLVTATESLSSVLGALLMSAAAEASSWRDMRRLAGPGFARVTASTEADPATVAAALRANRENLARWLNIFRAKLSDTHAALLAEDDEPLIKLLTEARDARDRWLRDAHGSNWGDVVETPQVSMGQMLGQMFWPQRSKPDGKKQKR